MGGSYKGNLPNHTLSLIAFYLLRTKIHTLVGTLQIAKNKTIQAKSKVNTCRNFSFLWSLCAGI